MRRISMERRLLVYHPSPIRTGKDLLQWSGSNHFIRLLYTIYQSTTTGILGLHESDQSRHHQCGHVELVSQHGRLFVMIFDLNRDAIISS